MENGGGGTVLKWMNITILNTILGLLATGGIMTSVIQWWRNRSKDKADVSKVQAEANSIIVENFKSLLKTYQDENKLLQITVNELKTEVYKLREQVQIMEHGKSVATKQDT
jgi:glutamate dehydrogenase/leucine dehydrogenase